MGEFNVNDYVFHIRCGACLVKDIAALPGDENGTKFYVLSPLYGDDRGNIVRVPYDNPASLRPTMGESEGKKLLSEWPSMAEEHYVVDSKKRKLMYEEALSKGDLSLMALLLVGARQRKKKDGHLNSMDGQFVAKAEPIVIGELAQCLGRSYEEISQEVAAK